jgi:hypothetical protein
MGCIKIGKIAVTTAGVPAKIRTHHLSDTVLEIGRYTKLNGVIISSHNYFFAYFPYFEKTE